MSPWHFLVDDRPETVHDRNRGPQHFELVDRVTFRLKPTTGRRYIGDDKRAWFHEEADTLTALEVKLPTSITSAIAAYDEARARQWPGLPEGLPLLPTLIAESKAIHTQSRETAVRQAWGKVGRAFTKEAQTIHAQLAKKMSQAASLNGSFGPLLREGWLMAARAWGQLEHSRNGSAFKPVGPGDPLWTIGNLNDWMADGWPKATPTTVAAYESTLRTPAEVIDIVRALGVRVTLEEPSA